MFWRANGKPFRQSGLCGKPEDICRNIEIFVSRIDNFLDLCFNPKLATEVTLQPIRRFGFDAAILFSDILVIPHALGQRVSFTNADGPN